jgi:Arabinose efflux permease
MFKNLVFRNRLYVSVATSHLAVDMLNSLGPVLLAVLAIPLALSNAQIGLALTLYTLAGAISQPFFGWWADRMGKRSVALGAIGVLWTTVFFIAVAFAGTWALILPLFVLASFGSGLFHPIGTATAAAAAPKNQAGTATSGFFFAGQAGLALGPILGGLLFGNVGAFGILPLAAVAFIPALSMLFAPPPSEVGSAKKASKISRYEATLFAIIAFVVLVAVRSSIQAGYQSFLPKLFADRNWEPWMYGWLAGTFMFTAAIGNMATGIFADRYGMRAATVWPLLLSIPSGLICLWAPTVAAAFITSALAGLFICGQHSVLVLHAQRLLPTQKGFASGLILGFTFATGGLGTWLAGIAGDIYGLLPTMQVLTVLALPCALLALTLPGREEPEASTSEQIAPSPATTGD